MKETVTVIGAGSWGTALAIVLADNGRSVRLWGRNREQIEAINKEHRNERYLPGVDLPNLIYGTTDLEEALSETETVVLVTPTKSMREVLGKIKKPPQASGNVRSCI